MGNSRQSGFTLVEIAIVVAVVGLLIGGVLKGSEMITNARLKRIESDQSKLATAIMAYQDRYRQLPGDDRLASQRFSIYTDGNNDPAAIDIDGGGDGYLDGDWIAVANSETANVWKHLRASGLIEGSGDDDSQPKNSNGGLIGLRDTSLQLPGIVTVFGSLEGPVMRILEARLDDGSPTEGRIQAELTAAQMNANIASTAGSIYLEDTLYFVAFQL
jgi:prepilin-type N-terminal cleavage/methylation domain-containing protein